MEPAKRSWFRKLGGCISVVSVSKELLRGAVVGYSWRESHRALLSSVHHSSTHPPFSLLSPLSFFFFFFFFCSAFSYRCGGIVGPARTRVLGLGCGDYQEDASWAGEQRRLRKRRRADQGDQERSGREKRRERERKTKRATGTLRRVTREGE